MFPARAEPEVDPALIAESPAPPELVAIGDHACRQLGEACTRPVEMPAGGGRDRQIVQDARRLHAIIDGLAIHLLTERPSQDSGWAIRIVEDEPTRLARLGAGPS